MQFNNFDLEYGGYWPWPMAVKCRVRNSTAHFTTLAAQITGTLFWTHAICSYDQVAKSLSIYINGEPYDVHTASRLTTDLRAARWHTKPHVSNSS